MSNEFVWTDELVREFVCDLLWWRKDEPKPQDFSDGKYASNTLMEQFKQSKFKKELFKTEDGVSIYEGDDYFYVDWEDFEINRRTAQNNLTPVNKTFSTEQAANNYVLMNKPCLSLSDVITRYKEWLYNTSNFSILQDEFKKLAQEKINTK